MADIVEIIISAIDKASPVFGQIGSEVSEMASEVDSAVDGVDADKLAEEFNDVDSAIDGIDGSSLTDIDSDVEQLEKELTEATNEVERLEDALDQAHLDGDDIEADRIADELAEATAKAEQLQQSLEQAGTSNGLDKLGNDIQKDKSKFTQLKETILTTFESAKGIVTGFGSTIQKIGGKVTGLGGKIRELKNNINHAGVDATNAGASFGFLRDAASMTVGMIGYDLLNSLVETTKASLNARSSIQAFASRLSMSASEVSDFQTSLDELQSTYKKIDMDVVGQQATDMAYRLGLPKTSLTELTETTAIFTDAMQRNGRSAEDSMLAMSDAMDGQFVRLKEIGIGQDDLMKNGWSGDINDKTGLLHAMNAALKEQHYDELAQSVDTLDEAWQVLSITLSNLLEAILVPLTPIIVEIVGWITNAVDAIRPLVQTLQNSWDALPDWMKDSAWAIALGIGIALVAFYIQTTLIPALAEATLAAIDFAIAMMANPLTWIVLALVAVAVAIYEVGKAFGWWTDVQSMLAAIWAGIQRLWSAFINHPDVQAAIQALSDAWNWVASAIGWVWDSLMGFFGTATGGDFDIVRALIDGVGAAWEAIKGPIEFVVGLITAAGEAGNATADVFGAFWNDTLVPFGEWLSSIFAPVWQLVGDLINAISPFVTNLMNAFSLFATGQMDLPTLIWTVLTTLFNAYVTIFSMIVSRVASWGQSIISRGVSAVSSFVSGIVNRIMSLPGRVYSILLGVVSKIVSAIQAWITSAKNKAQGIVDGVGNVLQGTYNAVTSALSNVAKAIVKPFEDGYNEAKKWWDKITTLNGALGGETAWGGETFDAVTGEKFNISTGEYIVDDSTVTVEGEVTQRLIIDLEKVPSHIDNDTLIKALKNKDVLHALTSNNDFQTMDQQVKDKIAMKIKRSRGV